MKHTLKVMAVTAALLFAAPPLANLAGPALSFFQPSESVAREFRIPKFHFGRLKCAQNVNAFLRLNKRRVTNSLAAASFLKFKRVSSPQRGDLRYNKRPGGGGHVSIYWGNGLCLNPRQNVGWRKVPCNQIWGRMKHTWVRP